MGIVEFMLMFFLSKLGFAVIAGVGLVFIMRSIKEEAEANDGD